jgi:hypothetical protein
MEEQGYKVEQVFGAEIGGQKAETLFLHYKKKNNNVKIKPRETGC